MTKAGYFIGTHAMTNTDHGLESHTVIIFYSEEYVTLYVLTTPL